MSSVWESFNVELRGLYHGARGVCALRFTFSEAALKTPAAIDPINASVEALGDWKEYRNARVRECIDDYLEYIEPRCADAKLGLVLHKHGTRDGVVRLKVPVRAFYTVQLCGLAEGHAREDVCNAIREITEAYAIKRGAEVVTDFIGRPRDGRLAGVAHGA